MQRREKKQVRLCFRVESRPGGRAARPVVPSAAFASAGGGSNLGARVR